MYEKIKRLKSVFERKLAIKSEDETIKDLENKAVKPVGENKSYEKETNPKEIIEKYIKERVEIKPEERVDYLNKEKSINPECKVSVVIPSYRESNSILGTLESLYNQKESKDKPLDPKFFEVLIVVNHERSADEDVKKDNEKTIEMIEKFRKEHPELKIYVIKKEFNDNEGGVGSARKRGMDEALLRFYEQGKYDGIIAATDADTKLDNYWIKNIIETFNKEKIDAIAGKVRWQEDLEVTLDKKESEKVDHLLYLSFKYESLKRELQSEQHYELILAGSNFAVNVLAYARAGGMNKKKLGEDGQFKKDLIKANCKIKYAEDVIVNTSKRTSSKAEGGIGSLIKRIIESQKSGKPFLVPHPKNYEEKIPIEDAIKLMEMMKKRGEKIPPPLEVENSAMREEIKELKKSLEGIYQQISDIKLKKQEKEEIGGEREKNEMIERMKSDILISKYFSEHLEEIYEIAFRSQTISDFFFTLVEKYTAEVKEKLKSNKQH